MQHIDAEFGFEIGFLLSENSSVTLPYTRDIWDNENVITYTGFFVVDQSEEDISDCKGLRDVAMATKFWSK